MTNGEIVRTAIARASDKHRLCLSPTEAHWVALEVFKELAAYNKTIVPYSMLGQRASLMDAYPDD